MRFVKIFLISSIIISNSPVSADSQSKKISFRLFSEPQCNGQSIEWARAKEIIRGINDPVANHYIYNSGNWRTLGFVALIPGEFMILVGGVLWTSKKADLRRTGAIVFLSGTGLFGLGFGFEYISEYYKAKAIDRYNKVAGGPNESSSLFLSPGGGEYTIGFRYSF